MADLVRIHGSIKDSRLGGPVSEVLELLRKNNGKLTVCNSDREHYIWHWEALVPKESPLTKHFPHGKHPNI